MQLFSRTGTTLLLLVGASLLVVAQDRGRTTQRFSQMEKKLLGAKSLSFTADIQAQGAVNASFSGQVVLGKNNSAVLAFEGHFMHEKKKPALVSDGSQMVRGEENAKETPSALNEGLVVGLTRMGILHNLAMLSTGNDPDATDGKVQQYAVVSELIELGLEERNGVEVVGVAFKLSVAGKHAADGLVWIDVKTNLPVSREQTVQFDSGEMKVIETYRDFKLNETLAPDTFKLPES